MFFVALKWKQVRLIEPYLFLGIALIPIFESPETIFGFGLFAVGAIMLGVDGQLDKHPIPKLVALGVYFFAVILSATLVTRSLVEGAIALVLFDATFFLFLFFTFQDTIIVFVRSDKPTVSLKAAGLTRREAQHLLALVAGKTIKEIAFEAGVKDSTVRNSLSRAYRRLGFTDKAHVLQWAADHTLVP